MRTMIFSMLVLCFAWPASTFAAKEKVFEETSGRKGLYLFRNPRMKTPEEQISHADGLLEEGRVRRAMRQYLALRRFWPESREAAEAQYKYARLLDHRGQLQSAFDEYQLLFEQYTGFFPYDEVLQRQFEIAETLLNRRKGQFFFFPGFAAPERAAPLFETVVQNGPHWERAAEAQFLAGMAYEKAREYEQAVAAYMRTQQRYPSSPVAEKGSFRAAHGLFTLAKESPNNKQVIEHAWAATILFLSTYPKSEYAEEARDFARTLRQQRARLAYQTATYYDRIEKRPKAALIAYQSMLNDYPDSEWAEDAKTRIQELERKTENKEAEAGRKKRIRFRRRQQEAMR